MYVRDPQWLSVCNHDNDDVTTDKHGANQRRRWHSSAPADNCSDGGPKRQRAETEHFDAGSGVSARWRRNHTMCDKSRDRSPEISVPRTEEVSDSQRQLSHALHLASTLILGLLVVEVR